MEGVIMRTMRAGIGLVVIAAWACQPHRPAAVGSLEQILSTVPDSAMQGRWRRAAAAGQLPPLNTLPTSAEVVRKRVPTTVQQPVQPVKPPHIDSAAVADVRLFSTQPVDRYRGSFTVTEVAPGRIVGRLESRSGSFEILYKLPGGRPLPVTTGAQLSLTLRDEVVDATLQRQVLLVSPDGRLVLLALSEGGREVYVRSVESTSLTMRQQPPAGDSTSALGVAYAGQEFSLRPGERHRVSDANGTVEFFLLANQFTPPAQVLLSEGDAYHVRVFAYRVE
jgi:hypothetical protein